MTHPSLIEKAVTRLASGARVEPLRFTPETVAPDMPGRPRPTEGKASAPRPAVPIDRSMLMRRNIISPENERSRTIEEYRLIKRGLLTRYALSEAPRQNLILVTSSIEGEGKTFNALNLAMSIALEKDYRVLLMDCDLTRPSVMRTLGIEADRGLIDVLVDDRLDLSDVLIRTDIDGLTVLPPGHPHSLSTELLASNKMASLMDEITQRYRDRIIIMDTPPVLVTSETSVLAQLVGQILFVIQSERTPRETVREGLELLAHCTNISLLLNGTSDALTKSRFGSYYKNYQKKAR